MVEQLGGLRVADLARFEALRADLKKQTACRVTLLDRLIGNGSCDQADGGGRVNGSSTANRLVVIARTALNGWENLFLSTQDHQAFADLTVTGHRETCAVDSDYFRYWLTEQYAEQTGDTPGGEALNAAINRILAKARFGGQRRPVFIRCGVAEDRQYLDLCDEMWQCVEISKDGWRVISSANSPVRFRRYLAMDVLPTPARGGDIEALRPYVNVSSDEDFVLLVAWLLAALRSSGPYPVLVLSGEPGSAKSTVAKILRALADPSYVPTRVFPNTDEDIFLDASHNHLLVFDNLSSLSHAASDLLCQLATGGGFGRRQLYSNQEEFLLHASRPVLLNGIENVAVRSDLARPRRLSDPGASRGGNPPTRIEIVGQFRGRAATHPWRAARRLGRGTESSAGHPATGNTAHGRFRVLGRRVRNGLLAGKHIPGRLFR